MLNLYILQSSCFQNLDRSMQSFGELGQYSMRDRTFIYVAGHDICASVFLELVEKRFQMILNQPMGILSSPPVPIVMVPTDDSGNVLSASGLTKENGIRTRS